MQIWDEQALLERCRQKPARARNMVCFFLEDAPKLLQNLERHNHDFISIKSNAHELKGLSSNLGAWRLQDASFDLETAAYRHNQDLCDQQMLKVRDEFSILLTKLKGFLLK